MSHSRERKEKDCLNCGTIVEGRYCQSCGQENVEPKETFWHMFTHFFNDITHFDGKFFTTLKDLLFKPGFLSSEYMKGKRMSYLNPVRMYVFTSAIFFLVFFSLRKVSDMVNLDEAKPLTEKQRERKLDFYTERVKNDSTSKTDQQILARLQDTTRQISQADIDELAPADHGPDVLKAGFNSIHAYDSTQASLPEAKKDGWFRNKLVHKSLKFDEEYKRDKKKPIQKIIEVFMHNLPYLLFVSLPFFALILKLLYVRNRKHFYYADHGIFTIHHYIFSFILMLFIILLSQLNDLTGWKIWDIIVSIAIISWPVHLFLAMRRFYGQRKIKTFAKFLLLNFLGVIALVFLFVLFGILSVFQL